MLGLIEAIPILQINFYKMVQVIYLRLSFPSSASAEEHANARDFKRGGFYPWVGKIPWRRAQQPTAVFLPGESHGQRSLAGYSPWGSKESDTTEMPEHTHAESYSRGCM